MRRHTVDAGMHGVLNQLRNRAKRRPAAAAVVGGDGVDRRGRRARASTKDVPSAGAFRTRGKRSGEACDTITSLAETVKHSAGQVESLGSAFGRNQPIAGVIMRIADQTNLLA